MRFMTHSLLFIAGAGALGAVGSILWEWIMGHRRGTK